MHLNFELNIEPARNSQYLYEFQTSYSVLQNIHLILHVCFVGSLYSLRCVQTTTTTTKQQSNSFRSPWRPKCRISWQTLITVFAPRVLAFALSQFSVVFKIQIHKSQLPSTMTNDEMLSYVPWLVRANEFCQIVGEAPSVF